jgi:oligogalacturonide transport system permease protein
MLSTLMLPHTVTIIPKFILFNRLKWLNTYNTFIIPALFAGNPFFIFMMVQFFRGIPIELDNVAKIDGCNSFRILYNIHIPLMKPVVFSVFVFQFMWTWNNFFDALVYISDVRRYPLSLALRMSIDSTTGIMWNEVLAMSFLSILPSIVVFFLAQKYFVEGIATTGMKG